MKVVSYARVSTDKQVAEGYGMEEQQQAITAFCQANGHEVIRSYEDKGISGGELELREDMLALLQAAKRSEFQAVVVTKIDRLARSLYGQLFVEKELAVAGIAVLYVQQETLAGADPMTTTFRHMMAVFAELEKSLIKARLSGGRLAKARDGGYAGGAPPYGYTAVKGSKSLTLNHQQAETIRRVFQLRKDGLTTRAIAGILNTEHRTTAQNKPFTFGQVARILKRRDFYRGIYQYGGVSAPGEQEVILG